MLNTKLIASSAAVFLALSFVLCVGFGLVAPGNFHMKTLLETVLPGFQWLSPGAFALGFVESLLWGLYLGGGYAWVHNLLSRRAALGRSS
ncbi:DUF5676 family membrane protein [uncultured Arenimonas sp.]|uniref:DUF5676 family membrane protein n=1 Tax=uncultured Arenimonas sp. TaxID=546226 RepID=UPI0030D7501A